MIRCRFRLYPGRDDDLIEWVKSLDNLPYGGKGQAVKEALRKGLGFSMQGSTGVGKLGSSPHAPTHSREASPQGGSSPAQDDLLLDIRRVVEAAVSEALNQMPFEISPDSGPVSQIRDTDDAARVDQLMAEMYHNLLLPEDEDSL